MEEALAALDRAIRLRPVFDDFDRGFEAKYANASPEVLKQAEGLVRTRMRELQDSISRERLSMGLFETGVVADGDPPTHIKGQKGKAGPTIISGFNEPSGNGSMITKTVTIDPEEYPELNSVLREYQWLRRRIPGPPSTSAR